MGTLRGCGRGDTLLGTALWDTFWGHPLGQPFGTPLWGHPLGTALWDTLLGTALWGPPLGTPFGTPRGGPTRRCPRSFPVRLCVSVSGRRIPDSVGECSAAGRPRLCDTAPPPHRHRAATAGLLAELRLDRLKQRGHRRVLLLHGRRAVWRREVAVAPGMSPQCHHLDAYLRVRNGDCRCAAGTARGGGQCVGGGDSGYGVVMLGMGWGR